MKIRTGFVSNSSSSSFLVAVPKNVSEYDEHYIEIFLKYLNILKKDPNYNVSLTTYDELVEQLKDELKDLEEEYMLAQKAYNRVAEFMGNKSKQSAVDQFMKIARTDIQTLDNKCHYRNCSYIDKMRPMNDIASGLMVYVSGCKERIDEHKKHMESMISHKDAKYICKFELDVHGNRPEGEILKLMVEKGIVKLITKETS